MFRFSFERRNTTVNNFLIDPSIKKALIVILYRLLFVLGWIFLVVKLAFASELTKRFKIAKNGGAMRDRTADLLRARQALSQLSYSPHLLALFGNLCLKAFVVDTSQLPKHFKQTLLKNHCANDNTNSLNGCYSSKMEFFVEALIVLGKCIN